MNKDIEQKQGRKVSFLIFHTTSTSYFKRFHQLFLVKNKEKL